MSQASFPSITPTISLSLTQSIPLLLDSIALEELALAHLVNAEAENIQFTLGQLTTGVTLTPSAVSISDLLRVNSSVNRTLRRAIEKEMILEFKFENVLNLLPFVPVTPTPPATTCGCTVSDQAGTPFKITRGINSSGTDVTYDSVPVTNGGNLTYSGFICPNCSANGQTLSFDYAATGTSPVPGPFVFNATTFSEVPNCPDGAVTVTGLGTATGSDLGPNVSYIFTANETAPFISITITGNGQTFTAITTNIGGGELAVTNCSTI